MRRASLGGPRVLLGRAGARLDAGLGFDATGWSGGSDGNSALLPTPGSSGSHREWLEITVCHACYEVPVRITVLKHRAGFSIHAHAHSHSVGRPDSGPDVAADTGAAARAHFPITAARA